LSLTPGRSIAVDRRFHPLGALFWLDSRFPEPEGGFAPLKRLMVAQDTGTAIRGAQRADVFWGADERAAEIAGRMKEPGELIALIPKDIVPGR
jgi:membrane-bound lytic murein transglycosylase A